MDQPIRDSSRALDAAEVEALLEALGQPSVSQVATAIEEVEHQVALEDLLILMMEAAQETVHVLVDFLVHLDPPRLPGLDHDEGAEP